MTDDSNDSDDWLDSDDPLEAPGDEVTGSEAAAASDRTRQETAEDNETDDSTDDDGRDWSKSASRGLDRAGNRASSIASTTGSLTGKFLGKCVDLPVRFTCALARGFTAGFTRRIPFMGASFWQDMVKFSTHQYQKATSADVVNFSAEAHGIEPRAANWQEADRDEPEQKIGWKEVGGSKTWGAGVEGQDTQRFGKADIILSDRSATEVATPLQMRVAEALDLEQVDGLITSDTTLEQTVVQQWPADPAEMNSNGQAVADGGMIQRQESPIQQSIGDMGFDDAVIDLASDFGDGNGMRISATKYKHQKLASSDPEEMQKQETRGYLAGVSGDNDEKLFYLAVIALFIILLISVGPTIITTLFGGGGGGGGGGGLPIILGGLL